MKPELSWFHSAHAQRWYLTHNNQLVRKEVFILTESVLLKHSEKIHIIPNTLFVKVFSVLPRRAMFGVTGLHYSENNYSLQRRLLSTVTGTTVILENCVSLGLEEASGRDRSFYRLLFQKRFWFVIENWWCRHKVTNTHRKFRSCSRWIQLTCLQLTDTSQTSSDGQILTTRSTPCFHCFLKVSLKESIIKTYQRTN